MDEPGAPLPGANMPPETVRLATVPEPVSTPPLTLAPPFNAPLFTVVPAVLVSRPDTVALALLLKVPAFAIVPVQVRLLVMVPVLATTLPVHVPLLTMAAALPSTLPLQLPLAVLMIPPAPVLVATLAT